MLDAELLRRVPLEEAVGARTASSPELAEHRSSARPTGRSFHVQRHDDGVLPGRSAKGIQRLLARHDLDNDEALAHVESRLRRIGVHQRAPGRRRFEPGTTSRSPASSSSSTSERLAHRAGVRAQGGAVPVSGLHVPGTPAGSPSGTPDLAQPDDREAMRAGGEAWVGDDRAEAQRRRAGGGAADDLAWCCARGARAARAVTGPRPSTRAAATD